MANGSEHNSGNVDDSDNDMGTMLATQELLRSDEEEGEDGQSDSTLTTTSCIDDFIPLYSTINVVRHAHFARSWNAYSRGDAAFDATIGPFCHVGHSRDDPTPFEYFCQKTQGCTYKSHDKDCRQSHELICNVDYAARLDVASCYDDPVGYYQHLLHKRGRDTWAKREPFMLEKRFKEWEPTTCLCEGCVDARTFTKKVHLKSHLTNKRGPHKMDHEQAEAFLLTCGYKRITSWGKGKRKRPDDEEAVRADDNDHDDDHESVGDKGPTIVVSARQDAQVAYE
ncbi:MAG: hypothetical protein M1816_005627 [Peltula sp. TS41687]|nr:MAG: hypothetical protein M1816_005627 [Peltula sp. TS41687]